MFASAVSYAANVFRFVHFSKSQDRLGAFQIATSSVNQYLSIKPITCVKHSMLHKTMFTKCNILTNFEKMNI